VDYFSRTTLDPNVAGKTTVGLALVFLLVAVVALQGFEV
jgi:hypothetical protein